MFAHAKRQSYTRNSVVEDAMRRDPDLFHRLSEDHLFHDLLVALEEAIASFRDPNSRDRENLIAAKRAGLAIAPYQREFFTIQKEIALLRARDFRRPEKRPELVFEDAPQDPNLQTIQEAGKRSQRMLAPSAQRHIPTLKHLAQHLAEKEIANPKRPEQSITIDARHVAGYPSGLERLLRPSLAARKVITCEAIAAKLSADWTSAKDGFRDNARIRHLEHRMDAIQSVLEFVNPYQQELDDYARTSRIGGIRERNRAKLLANRAHAVSTCRRTVIDFEAYLPAKKRAAGHAR